MRKCTTCNVQYEKWDQWQSNATPLVWARRGLCRTCWGKKTEQSYQQTFDVLGTDRVDVLGSHSALLLWPSAPKAGALATLGDLVACSHGLLFIPFALVSLPEASILDVAILYGAIGAAFSRYMKQRDFRKAVEDAKEAAKPLRNSEASLSPIRAAALREGSLVLSREGIDAISSEAGAEAFTIRCDKTTYCFVHPGAGAIAGRLNEWKNNPVGMPLQTMSRTDRPPRGEWEALLDALIGDGELALV